ncbi:MAG: hypothetical protein WAU41_08900 [Gaiellaceae bacterium]
MTKTTVESSTGNLIVSGKRVFPIGLSDPPPVDGVTPGGGNAWAEIARAGVTFARNYTVWTEAAAAEQLISVGRQLDAASKHGLQIWLALAGVDNDLSHQALLTRVVNIVKGHPGLGAWKGADEPAHGHVPAAGLVAVRKHLRSLDADHPLVIIQAPRAPASSPKGADKPLTAASVAPYAAACDIHGVDIYPVSKPAGMHAGGPPVSTDISVVGDMTAIIAKATRRKAIWMTLQISWSGVFPPHPVVMPTLQQARFMAYDAIVAGARGLFFFGGQYKQVMNAADRERGWNWTYWNEVQRPLVEELASADHAPALTALPSSHAIRTTAPHIGLSAREAGGFLYLIAVRRSPAATGKVRFTGLPARITHGIVLAHGRDNPERAVTASGGAFTDPSPFGPHNARVYRFPLPG